MDRRTLLVTLAGGMLVAPLAGEAQQKTVRIGFLGNGSVGTTDYVGDLRRGLREFGYVEGDRFKIFEVRAVEDFPRAFEAAKQGRAQALLQLGSPLFGSNPVPVAELARMHRLPSMCEQQRLTAAGCLMSYGPNFSEMYRRAAYYVDKILKGAKPADLPVEQPTKFELVINLKTAKALGLTIPQSVLQRADQVIQ